MAKHFDSAEPKSRRRSHIRDIIGFIVPPRIRVENMSFGIVIVVSDRPIGFRRRDEEILRFSLRRVETETQTGRGAVEPSGSTSDQKSRRRVLSARIG